MNNLLKKISKQNAKDMRAELARTHLIICLLSISSIALLVLGANITVELDATLATIACILLSVVTVISMAISYTLFTNKK